jgi:VWFA-related protein
MIVSPSGRRPFIGGGPLAHLLSAACLVLMAPNVGSAQTAASDDSPRVFVDSVNVDVVNIDVYVRDEDGNPVPGLKQEDFELLVDGKMVAISNFYSIDDDSNKRSASTAGDPPAGETFEALEIDDPGQSRAPVLTARKSSRPPDQQLHVVIYIDNFNLSPFNRNRVLRELREFLRTELDRDDMIMLATYDRFLNLRQPFTNDPEVVNRRLLELEEVSAQRIHRDRERVDIINNIEDVNNESVQYAINQLRAFAGSVFNETNVTIDALNRVVENLASSPGRKALIYVSEGLPMIAAEDMFFYVNQLYERQFSMTATTEYDVSSRFRQLTSKANSNRVSFYTIDARGLTVLTSGTVDQNNAQMAGQGSFIDQVRTTNTQSSIQMMAEETGGRFVINTNKFMPDLKKIALDFNHYYSLGYTPDTQTDGRYHDIKVKLAVAKRGWEVRHRTGYRTKSVESKMIDGTLSAMNLNLQNNPIDARLRFATPTRDSSGNYAVQMLLEVPWQNITLLPQQGAYRGRIKVWIVAKDVQDRTTEPTMTELKIDIPPEKMNQKGEFWRYPINLTLEGGYHDIGLGVRDELGAQSAFLRQGIDLGG